MYIFEICIHILNDEIIYIYIYRGMYILYWIFKKNISDIHMSV